MRAGSAEGGGGDGQRVTCRRLLQNELEAALFSACQIPVDQFGAVRAGCAAGGRPQLRQGSCVITELRVILRLAVWMVVIAFSAAISCA